MTTATTTKTCVSFSVVRHSDFSAHRPRAAFAAGGAGVSLRGASQRAEPRAHRSALHLMAKGGFLVGEDSGGDAGEGQAAAAAAAMATTRKGTKGQQQLLKKKQQQEEEEEQVLTAPPLPLRR